MFSPRLLVALCIAFTMVVAPAVAGDPDQAWAAVVALDAGPQAQPRTREEAQSVAMAHLDRQEKALRGFLAGYPTDSRTFEGRIRLSRLLQIRAQWQKSDRAKAEARRLLDEADKQATPEQKREVDFAKLTFLMRTLRESGMEEREQLLAAARRFQSAHPEDRRLPAVLAEIATLFDAQPVAKRALLSDALALAQDEEHKGRIADDLKRLDLLGEPVALSFKSVQGKQFEIAEHRGKVLVLVFFADWSPPSITALQAIQKALHEFPRERVQAVGISLDNKSEELTRLVQEHKITWPIAFDGKGWMGPLPRGFGINTLPTVWLIDRDGRLRSLNAVESPISQIRQLLQGASRP